jgi:hypothetical protein
MKNFVKAALITSALLAPVQAFAVTNNVIFNGTVNNTCAITIVDAGILATNVGQTQLSSTNAGGQAGTATLATTSTAYSVTVNAPTAFDTQPATAGVSTFAASYGTTGATVLAAGQTTLKPLSVGTTTVAINMTATKATGAYPTGTYAATVVLRCE